MTLTRQGGALAIVRGLGAPETLCNVEGVVCWQYQEGGAARCNPLNTASQRPPVPGATPYNTFMSNGQELHVWNYPDWDAGLGQTLKWLRNGHYVKILATLQAGRSHPDDPVPLMMAINDSVWGTKFRPTIADLLDEVRRDWGAIAFHTISGT